MAATDLIEDYLAALSGQLPAPCVEEIADGLAETYEHHLAQGLGEQQAAVAALTEFGDSTQVLAAFTDQAVSRRTARALLASGPAVGASWAVVLVVGRVTSWPVPAPVLAALAGVLLLTAAALLGAAHTRRIHLARRAAMGGCCGLITVDLAALTAFYLLMPAPCWPLYLAAPATAVQLVCTAEAARLIHARPA